MTAPQTLAGRRALVTGAASGIGAACATALAAAGAYVIVADINERGARALADRIGGQPWAVDLLDSATLAERHLDVDILVNNAGIQHIAPIESFDPRWFRRILTLLLEAPFLLIRAALPHMYAQGFGRIINITSVHGLRASPYQAAYVAAKHGLEGLSKVTALEGGEHGVTSTCISPGYVRTPLVEREIAEQARLRGRTADEVLEQVLLAEAAVKRLVEVEEVADLAVWLAGPSAAMASGASFSLDGGWSAR